MQQGVFGPAWCRVCKHEWHEQISQGDPRIVDLEEREVWHLDLTCPHCEFHSGQFGTPADSGIEGWDISMA